MTPCGPKRSSGVAVSVNPQGVSNPPVGGGQIGGSQEASGRVKKGSEIRVPGGSKNRGGIFVPTGRVIKYPPKCAPPARPGPAPGPPWGRPGPASGGPAGPRISDPHGVPPQVFPRPGSSQSGPPLCRPRKLGAPGFSEAAVSVGPLKLPTLKGLSASAPLTLHRRAR